MCSSSNPARTICRISASACDRLYLNRSSFIDTGRPYDLNGIAPSPPSTQRNAAISRKIASRCTCNAALPAYASCCRSNASIRLCISVADRIFICFATVSSFGLSIPQRLVYYSAHAFNIPRIRRTTRQHNCRQISAQGQHTDFQFARLGRHGVRVAGGGY